MTDDLDSSSRGIWVFPYDSNQAEAGPSRRRERPLKEIYDSSLQAYRSAYEAYEDERGESQLDDLTDWLTHPSDSQFYRLPIAVLQTKKVHGQIYSILGDKSEVVGIQGRDIVDIGSGVRAIVSALVGEVPTKSGLTGLDQVEAWWKGRKGSIILHIQDTQVISPQVLGEIIYIISLHPKIPFRLLLSVPSSSTFLKTWQLLEPSSIDLTILQRGAKRGNALHSMLDTAKISVGDELAGVLKRDQDMFGLGPEAALKAIQWEMLHHSVNSPLATLALRGDAQSLGAVETILSLPDDVPGKDLLRLSTGTDLGHVTDPSPRISILHALGNTSSFTAHLPRNQHTNGDVDVIMSKSQASPSTPKKRKSRHHESTEEVVNEPPQNEQSTQEQKGDLEHLEVLYNLWKGAGKQVNLWDWLQGYKNHITGQNDNDDGGDNENGNDNGNGNDNQVEVNLGDDERQDRGDGKKRKRENDVDINEDGIHASFVRFCEEARMLGMVRARGKGVGRKADEVVKGVTLL